MSHGPSGKMLGAKMSFEAKVDILERKLKEKIEVSAAFADDATKAKKLEQVFRFFDRNGTGKIDYANFFQAMTKLNFIGVQREMEALFNRYDDDGSGFIEYREFASHLFELKGCMTLDPDSRDIIERVKARLLSNGGVSGINGIRRMIARMDTDSSKTVDREEFRIGLRDYGVTNISDADMDKLFNYFDKDRSGRINAHEFLRGLSTGMSYERKQLVREAFNRLDLEKKGYITSSDILMCYDVSGIPEVAGTAITPEQAAQRMMVTLSPETYDTGVITWANFLDYYKDLSLAITDDDYFELMIRNSWHLGGGVGDTQSTTTRRIVVVHSNGRQEVVELMDDLGINWRENDTEAIIERLEQQGVRDIAGIKL